MKYGRKFIALQVTATHQQALRMGWEEVENMNNGGRQGEPWVR